MQLKWLEDFLLLAETRSFSRSAEIRNVTQPAFGRRIRSLEAWIGVELIDRSTFPPTLTPPGKLFHETARETVQALSSAREMHRLDRRQPLETLSVAASHTLGVTRIPWLVKEFERCGEPVDIQVIATNSHDGIQLLLDGGCDFSLSYHHPDIGALVDESRYPYIVLGADRLIPLSAAGPDGRALHALPGTRDAPVRYLPYTSTIFLSRAVGSIFERQGSMHLQPVCRADMTGAVKAMILAGQGMGWLPASFVEHEIASGVLVPAFPEGLDAHECETWSAPLELRLYRSSENCKTVSLRVWSALRDRLFESAVSPVP